MRPYIQSVLAAVIIDAALAMAAQAADPSSATDPFMSALNADATLPSDGSMASIDIASGGSPLATQPGSSLSSVSNGSASGVSTNPSNNTTGAYTLPGIPLPNSPPPRIGLFTGLGKTLLDSGIDFHGVAFDHFLTNPTAGVVPGQIDNLAVLGLEADLDLNKLVSIRGGNVHVQFTLFGLKDDIPQFITESGGFLTGTQSTPAEPSNALSVLTYEQKLIDDRLSIEIGRTNVYHYFFLPNSLDPFTYFSSTVNVDGDFSTNPWPNWAGRATYHWTPEWYAQVGAFEDNFIRSTSNPDNFGITDNTGFQTLGEVGYRSEFNNAAYPANLELGALWDDRTSPTNLKGTAAFYNGRNSPVQYGSAGVLYFQGLKTLWRGASRHLGPPANVAVYGSVDVAVDKPQPVDMDALAGITFTGFIPRRPFDALEFQAHYQRLSQVEANYETLLHNIFAGRGPSQSRDGYTFEVNGNIQLTPWFALRPIVEQFTNPDNLFDPAQKRRSSDGFMTAIFATISLGKLLGTSDKPF